MISLLLLFTIISTSVLLLKFVWFLFVIMDYTPQQRAKFVRIFYQENSSYQAFKARIKRETKKSQPKMPSLNSIQKWVEDFESTGSVQSRRGKSKTKLVRTEENIEKVREHFEAHPHDSVRRNGLKLTKDTIHRILREDLNWHPYKIQILQTLRNPDQIAR